MSDNPLISVVMPAYNAERYVGAAVESILAQTFTDFEFIIIDDGSQDETGNIVRKFGERDPRIILIDQTNQGLVKSLNTGCAKARGKYIARMDADDISHPERFARQVAYLEEHPKVAVVGGSAEYLTDSGILPELMTRPIESAEIRAMLQQHCAMIHPATMFRRDAFEEVGGYRGVFVDAEDYDLWVRLSEKYELHNLPEVVLQYRIHPKQASAMNVYSQSVKRLAVPVSARLRRETGTDPFNTLERIDIGVLRGLGMSVKTIEQTLMQDARDRICGTLSGHQSQNHSQIVDELERLLAGWKLSRSSKGQIKWLRSRISLARGQTWPGICQTVLAFWYNPGLLLAIPRWLKRKLRLGKRSAPRAFEIPAGAQSNFI
jgi:glycosyltransferase involved in cell wall biosynthesis